MTISSQLGLQAVSEFQTPATNAIASDAVDQDMDHSNPIVGKNIWEYSTSDVEENQHLAS